MGTVRSLFILAIVVGAFGASRVGSGDPPDIQVAPASLLLGPVPPEEIAHEDLVVYNGGGSDLTFGEVTVDNPDFTFGTQSGGIPPGTMLAPGDSLVVTVSFRRSNTGIAFGALYFNSDDPDEPSLAVRLTGVVVPPASIAVVPSAFSETLAFQESVERDLTIVNTGSLALNWTLSALPSAAGGARGAALAGVRILWDRAHGQLASSFFSTLVSALESRGAIVDEAPALTADLLSRHQVLIVLEPSSAWTSEERGALTEWVRNGGSILMLGDRVGSLPHFNEVLTDLEAGITYESASGTAEVATTDVTSHPAVSGVSSVWLGLGIRTLTVTAPAEVLVRDTGGSVVAAARDLSGGRVVALADEFVDEGAIGQADNGALAQSVIDWLAGGSWLRPDAASGTTNPGGSAVVRVTFDAASLVAGTYTQRVRIESNDPANPVVEVPAIATVTGTPDLSLASTTVDFGFVPQLTQAVHALSVQNAGSEPLTVSSISTSGAAFSVTPPSLTVPAESSADASVTFAPDSIGPFTGTLTLVSDDPIEPSVDVALLGTGQLDCDAPCTTPSLTPEDVSGGDGLVFGLDVELAGNPTEVNSFGFVLQYDAKHLSFADSIEAGALIPNFLFVDAQENTPGFITCGGFVDPVNPPGIPAGSTGNLVRLWFSVDCDTCALGTTVNFVATDLVDDLGGLTGCCGTFTFSGCVSNGDVNGDRILSPADAQCAMRIFLHQQAVPAECDVSGDCEPTAADADCGGQVTPADALAIFDHHLAGGDPQLCLGGGRRGGGRALAWGTPRSSGENIVVSVHARGAVPTAFGVDVGWDPARLRLDRVDRGAAAEHWAVLDASIGTGRARIGGFEPAASPADGELARLVFRVVDGGGDAAVEALGAWDASWSGPARLPIVVAAGEGIRRFGPVPSPGVVTIEYAVAREGANVEVRIHDVRGRLVGVLASGAAPAGSHTVRWSGLDLSGRRVGAGTYFLSLHIDERSWTKRVVLVR